MDRVFIGPPSANTCGRRWAEEPEQWTGNRRFIFLCSPRLALRILFALKYFKHFSVFFSGDNSVIF